jgi:hypothetical protein
MSGRILKIEQISAPRNRELVVTLSMNRETGVFFANVGGKLVEETTKERAVKRIEELLGKITDVPWRQVILLRVDKRRNGVGDDCSQENSKAVYSASCSFTYLRRERAPNPLVKGRSVEREHADEFEARVLRARERVMEYEHGAKAKRDRADKEERQLREDRAALVRVDSPWTLHGSSEVEYEMPYTPEAWAGIQRIAAAIIEMQSRLDAFTAQASPEKLAALGTGDPLKLLPAAPVVHKTYEECLAVGCPYRDDERGLACFQVKRRR